MAGWIEIINHPSPVTAPGAVTLDVWDDPTGLDPDERPGDYLEYNDRISGETVKVAWHPAVDAHRATRDRYPPPAEAALVTLWKKDRRVVMSVTADGKTQDFYMPPARLVYLLRECAEQLAENTLIQ